MPPLRDQQALCHDRRVNPASLDQVAGSRVGLGNSATSEEPQHQFDTPFEPAGTPCSRHAPRLVAKLPTAPVIHQLAGLLLELPFVVS